MRRLRDVEATAGGCYVGDMQMTVTLDERLVDELRLELGVQETSALIDRALTEMRQRLAGERLAAMGGSDPDAKAAPRRRPPDLRNPD